MFYIPLIILLYRIHKLSNLQDKLKSVKIGHLICKGKVVDLYSKDEIGYS